MHPLLLQGAPANTSEIELMTFMEGQLDQRSQAWTDIWSPCS